MGKIIVQHEKIRDLAKNRLSAEKMIVFAAFCAERQLAVYEKLANGKSWNRSVLYRQMLDDLWDWLLLKKTRPINYAAECEKAILEDYDYKSDFEGIARDVGISLYGLIYVVENDLYEINSVETTIESSLDMIRSFLIDYLLCVSSASPESDSVIHKHQLITNEISEQNYCIETLLSPDYSVKATELLKERSSGKSLFENY